MQTLHFETIRDVHRRHLFPDRRGILGKRYVARVNGPTLERISSAALTKNTIM